MTNGTLDAQQMDQAIQPELSDHSRNESAIRYEKRTIQIRQETDQSDQVSQSIKGQRRFQTRRFRFCLGSRGEISSRRAEVNY